MAQRQSPFPRNSKIPLTRSALAKAFAHIGDDALPDHLDERQLVHAAFLLDLRGRLTTKESRRRRR